MKKTLTTLLTILILTSFIGTASGAVDEGRNTIDPGKSTTYTINFDRGEKVDVVFNIEVERGPNIDVWILDDENYTKYDHNKSFTAIKEKQNMSQWSGNVTFEEWDEYHFVMDNTPEGEAVPPAHPDKGEAQVHFRFERDLESTPGFTIPLLISITVVSTLIYSYHRKKTY